MDRRALLVPVSLFHSSLLSLPVRPFLLSHSDVRHIHIQHSRLDVLESGWGNWVGEICVGGEGAPSLSPCGIGREERSAECPGGAAVIVRGREIFIERLTKTEREQESQSGDASRDAGATCSSATACRVTTTSARWSTVINITWSSCSCRLIPRTSRSRLDNTLYASFKNVIAQEFNTAQVTAHLQKGGTNAKSLVLVPRRTSSRRPRQPSAKQQR